MEINSSHLEALIKEILLQKLSQIEQQDTRIQEANGILAVKVPLIEITEADRMNTGKNGDIVYTKDLFTLEQSKRLGCGIMEMKQTTFDWTLNYDEIDYVIEGTLSIIIYGKKVTANAGELILIPKGSQIQFSVADYARFLYITYPADWAGQTI